MGDGQTGSWISSDSECEQAIPYVIPTGGRSADYLRVGDLSLAIVAFGYGRQFD
jgi:hypothetical protein